jgi:hypothetical protein
VAITTTCGPHCGIRANAEDTLAREGHCPCGDPCHAEGNVPPGGVIRQRDRETAPSAPRTLDGQPLHGTPMCDSWHPHASTDVPDVNPWV